MTSLRPARESRMGSWMGASVTRRASSWVVKRTESCGSAGSVLVDMVIYSSVRRHATPRAHGGPALQKPYLMERSQSLSSSELQLELKLLSPSSSSSPSILFCQCLNERLVRSFGQCWTKFAVI